MERGGGRLVFFLPFRGGGLDEAKIYVLSGSCNKTNGRGDAELGTNMKGSGVWQQGAGAPPKDWMKLSLYNQGASAWLPPPLPTDRWGPPLRAGSSLRYQPTSGVKQCFSSPRHNHFKALFPHCTPQSLLSGRVHVCLITRSGYISVPWNMKQVLFDDKIVARQGL